MEVVEGVASVDESAITGESAPVVREAGGDRSAVTGGTRVVSDWLIVRVTVKPGESFLDRMIAMVEGAQRQKTPNEIALSILLAALTIVFLLATVTFSGESSTGWQQAQLSTPVALTANTTYIVSYYAPVGRYSATTGYFAGQALASPDVRDKFVAQQAVVADGPPAAFKEEIERELKRMQDAAAAASIRLE